MSEQHASFLFVVPSDYELEHLAREAIDERVTPHPHRHAIRLAEAMTPEAVLGLLNRIHSGDEQ